MAEQNPVVINNILEELRGALIIRATPGTNPASFTIELQDTKERPMKLVILPESNLGLCGNLITVNPALACRLERMS